MKTDCATCKWHEISCDNDYDLSGCICNVNRVHECISPAMTSSECETQHEECCPEFELYANGTSLKCIYYEKYERGAKHENE